MLSLMVAACSPESRRAQPGPEAPSPSPIPLPSFGFSLPVVESLDGGQPLTVFADARSPRGTHCQPQSRILVAGGGEPPYRWSLLEPAPSGFDLVQSGPRVRVDRAPESEAYRVEVVLVDSAGGAARRFVDFSGLQRAPQHWKVYADAHRFIGIDLCRSRAVVRFPGVPPLDGPRAVLNLERQSYLRYRSTTGSRIASFPPGTAEPSLHRSFPTPELGVSPDLVANDREEVVYGRRGPSGTALRWVSPTETATATVVGALRRLLVREGWVLGQAEDGRWWSWSPRHGDPAVLSWAGPDDLLSMPEGLAWVLHWSQTRAQLRQRDGAVYDSIPTDWKSRSVDGTWMAWLADGEARVTEIDATGFGSVLTAAAGEADSIALRGPGWGIARSEAGARGFAVLESGELVFGSALPKPALDSWCSYCAAGPLTLVDLRDPRSKVMILDGRGVLREERSISTPRLVYGAAPRSSTTRLTSFGAVTFAAQRAIVSDLDRDRIDSINLDRVSAVHVQAGTTSFVSIGEALVTDHVVRPSSGVHDPRLYLWQ